ncbi:MAG: M48 family metallopeptidase [Bacteroidota bacterium]
MFSADTILIILLFIISFDFFLGEILEYLNLKHQKKPLPNELEGIYEEEKYQKSIKYNEATTRFSFLTSSISFIATFLIIYFGWFGSIDLLIRTYFHNEITQALAFFGLIYFASDILTIPFQLYGTFVIEEKFGFNKTTYKTFFVDKIKGYVLSAILGAALLSILMFLILYLGKDFWIYFWIVISLFMLVMNLFYTSLILPLFNKLTPLEDGELKTAIEDYSKKVDFPLTNIFVIDGSKRSAKSNAFFSGMGKKKKIVLYDTLIENHSTEELVSVLAHEVGHYKKKHITWSMVLSVLQTGLTLFILSRMIFSSEVSYALGSDKTSFHLNILAFGILYSPLSQIMGIFMSMLSRKNEYEADDFAKTTYNGKALISALKRLSQDNLSNLMPHPWYVFLNYSHPPLKERIKALM